MADVHATGRDVLRAQQGIEISNRHLYELKRDEGMLQLRLRLLELRQSYLNQMNTQAALVGGCAVGLLASSELEVMNTETMCRKDGYRVAYHLMFLCLPFEQVVNMAYVMFAVSAVMWALWTIYLSNKLVSLTLIVALKGKGREDIVKLEELLKKKMGLIENGFHVSLGCLVGAVIAMVAEQVLWFALVLALPAVIAIGSFALSQTAEIQRDLQIPPDPASGVFSMLRDAFLPRALRSLRWPSQRGGDGGHQRLRDGDHGPPSTPRPPELRI